MFETAELGQTLTKEEYEARVPALRTELLRVQAELAKADFPVLLLIHGVEGSGKGDTLNLLHEWLDARYLHTQAFGEPTDEEQQRPAHWRYWMALPPRGRIGIWSGSWYSAAVDGHAQGEPESAKLNQALVNIRTTEKMLADQGALIIKLWFHVAKDQQKQRFRELESRKSTRWRVNKEDWKQHQRYDSFVRTAARVIRETSTGDAPWTVIEGTDARHRDVAVAEHVAQRISERLRATKPCPQVQAPLTDLPDPRTVLDALDLTRTVDRDTYSDSFPKLQGRLNRLAHKVSRKNRGVILLFEGPDASGKGGAIRRITGALDARQYHVIPIAAPTAEERAYHYLWRFWRHLPRLGRFTVYDRSWYGRVLVERVEGFASAGEWQRAYSEINAFEQHLVDHGIVLVKYWLQVSSDEQLRRFQDREQKPWKQYKIGQEDYRNRAKTNAYELAASDMIGRTGTEEAPWTLIEANDKRWARLRILETLCDRLEAEL